MIHLANLRSVKSQGIFQLLVSGNPGILIDVLFCRWWCWAKVNELTIHELNVRKGYYLSVQNVLCVDLSRFLLGGCPYSWSISIPILIFQWYPFDLISISGFISVPGGHTFTKKITLWLALTSILIVISWFLLVVCNPVVSSFIISSLTTFFSLFFASCGVSAVWVLLLMNVSPYCFDVCFTTRSGGCASGAGCLTLAAFLFFSPLAIVL